MKHLLRQQSLAGFAAVPPEQAPDGALDPPSRQRRALRAAARLARRRQRREHVGDPARRQARALRRRPRRARRPPGKPEWAAEERTAGSFRVEEFRVPLMRGVVQLPAGPAGRREEGGAPTSPSHTSPAAPPRALPVVLRGELRPRVFPAPDGLDAFTFANGPVRTGVFRDGEDAEGGDGEAARAAAAAADARRRRHRARPPRAAAAPDVAARAAGRARVPRSERRGADGRRRPCRSGRRAWLPGLRSERWALERGDLEAHAAVVDRARHAGRRRAGPGRRLRPPHLLDAHARRRRLLRLPAHHRGAAHRPALPGRHRRRWAASPARGRPDVAGRRRAGGVRHRPAGAHGGRQRRRLGGARRASSGSRPTTATASTCCPSGAATSRARPRASRCACRSARRPRWSRSSARAWATRASCVSRATEPVIEVPDRRRARPRTSSSRCWRCAAASATCSRRRWSTSAGRRSGSASPRSRSAGSAHELDVSVATDRSDLSRARAGGRDHRGADTRRRPAAARAARSPSPRSTRACSSWRPTGAGTSSTP